MRGKIKRVIEKKGFGFLDDVYGKEYFFHKSGLKCDWHDLVSDLDNDFVVEVEFEEEISAKGPRACKIRRV